MTKRKVSEQITRPPLKRVDLYINFNTQLAVSERRSEYYNLVKTSYPLVNIPKTANIEYNYGDCNFFSQDYLNMIGIATNYFSFSTIKYNKFVDFAGNFQKAWEEFQRLFGIESTTGIILIYENHIVTNKQIGHNFPDYFDVRFNFPGEEEKTFLAVEGNFYFSAQEGVVKLDFKPIPIKDRPILEPDYSFILEYRYTPKILGEKNTNIMEIINKGHKVIDDIFFDSLSDKYHQFIK